MGGNLRLDSGRSNGAVLGIAKEVWMTDLGLLIGVKGLEGRYSGVFLIFLLGGRPRWNKDSPKEDRGGVRVILSSLISLNNR